MRYLLLFALGLILCSPRASAQDDPPTAVTEALVTLRIAALDGPALARITHQVGQDTNVSLEYSCLRSGILVLHFRDIKASEKADILAVVRQLLIKATVRGAVDFLDVHVEQGSGNKC